MTSPKPAKPGKPAPTPPREERPDPIRSDHDREDDLIDEASRESFPASDPPSFNPPIGSAVRRDRKRT